MDRNRQRLRYYRTERQILSLLSRLCPCPMASDGRLSTSCESRAPTFPPMVCGKRLWNIDSGSASVRLDVEGLDDLAPLFGFVGDELAEVGVRARKQHAAHFSEPRLEFGIDKASVDFLVELLDDLGRRATNTATSSRSIAGRGLCGGSQPAVLGKATGLHQQYSGFRFSARTGA